MNKTSLVMAFFLAAVLTGLFLKYGSSVGLPSPVKENFMQQSVGMPLTSGGMGPYDSVSLAGGVSGWMASEPAPIVGAAPASTADDNKLMYLVGNKTDASCCPSAFNTDTGCVCLSEQDKSFMGSRGGNRA